MRCLDVEKAVWSELHVGEEGAEFSGFDISPDGRTAFVADTDGVLSQLDLRTAPGKATALGVVHDKKARPNLKPLTLNPKP